MISFGRCDVEVENVADRRPKVSKAAICDDLVLGVKEGEGVNSATSATTARDVYGGTAWRRLVRVFPCFSSICWVCVRIGRWSGRGGRGGWGERGRCKVNDVT